MNSWVDSGQTIGFRGIEFIQTLFNFFVKKINRPCYLICQFALSQFRHLEVIEIGFLTFTEMGSQICFSRNYGFNVTPKLSFNFYKKTLHDPKF